MIGFYAADEPIKAAILRVVARTPMPWWTVTPFGPKWNFCDGVRGAGDAATADRIVLDVRQTSLYSNLPMRRRLLGDAAQTRKNGVPLNAPP